MVGQVGAGSESGSEWSAIDFHSLSTWTYPLETGQQVSYCKGSSLSYKAVIFGTRSRHKSCDKYSVVSHQPECYCGSFVQRSPNDVRLTIHVNTNSRSCMRAHSADMDIDFAKLWRISSDPRVWISSNTSEKCDNEGQSMLDVHISKLSIHLCSCKNLRSREKIASARLAAPTSLIAHSNLNLKIPEMI